MTIDHLYPVRPGMLRGPVRGAINGRECTLDPCMPDGWGVYRNARIGEQPTHVFDPFYQGFVPVAGACLDLNDETARAQAAMPYTRVGCHSEVSGLPPCPDVALAVLPWDASIYVNGDLDRGQLTDEAYAHFCVLARMRMMDPSVTVAKARAALDWAHVASGGDR
jgi:hypothetical protein